MSLANENDRYATIIAIAKVGTPEVIPSLCEALHDPSGRNRMAAANALGEIASPDAVQPLILAATTDTQWIVRQAAVYALGAIRSPGALPVLTTALVDVDHEVRHAAAWALDRMTPDDVRQESTRLANEIDAAYERGDVDVADEVRYGALVEYMDGRATDSDREQCDFTDGVSIEEQFACNWAAMHQPRYRPFDDQAMLIDNSRAVLEEAQVGGFSPSRLAPAITDAQVLDALADAHQARMHIVERLRLAPAGEVERVKAWLRDRGISDK